jgi:hypothetical protein
LLRCGLALLLGLLLSLLAFCAPLLLLLALRLSRLLVILPALFLPLAITTPSLRLGLDVGADDCYQHDGQKSREALDKIKSHEPS